MPCLLRPLPPFPRLIRDGACCSFFLQHPFGCHAEKPKAGAHLHRAPLRRRARRRRMTGEQKRNLESRTRNGAVAADAGVIRLPARRGAGLPNGGACVPSGPQADQRVHVPGQQGRLEDGTVVRRADGGFRCGCLALVLVPPLLLLLTLTVQHDRARDVRRRLGEHAPRHLQAGEWEGSICGL